MLINVIGNLGSGKSTFLKELQKLEQYKNDLFISIDECRIRAAETTPLTEGEVIGSMEIEDYAWVLFEEAIINTHIERIFIESSGLSRRLNPILERKSGKIFTVKLSCNKEVAKERIYKRPRKNVPYPYNSDEYSAFDCMSKGIKDLLCDINLNTSKISLEELIDKFEKWIQSIK